MALTLHNLILIIKKSRLLEKIFEVNIIVQNVYNHVLGKNTCK